MKKLDASWCLRDPSLRWIYASLDKVDKVINNFSYSWYVMKFASWNDR